MILAILTVVPMPTLEAGIPVVTTSEKSEVVTTDPPSRIEKTFIPEISDDSPSMQHPDNSSMTAYPVG